MVQNVLLLDMSPKTGSPGPRPVAPPWMTRSQPRSLTVVDLTADWRDIKNRRDWSALEVMVD